MSQRTTERSACAPLSTRSKSCQILPQEFPENTEETADDESTEVTDGFDEIFAQRGGGVASSAQRRVSSPPGPISQERQEEQHSIGGAIKGFFRKVFKGVSVIRRSCFGENTHFGLSKKAKHSQNAPF